MIDGIFDNISIRDYHADNEYYSSTGIKEAKKSLAHFKYFHDNKNKDTKPHFDFGNSFELALLDPKGFKNDVAIDQDAYWVALANEHSVQETGKPYSNPRNSNVFRAEYSKWKAENEGKYEIPAIGSESFETIEKMLESCRKDSTIQKLIEGTEYQLSLFWTDEESGLKLKTRPDICKRKKNVVVNLKTTLDGSPKAFMRDMLKYNYPLQACLEIKGCLDSGLMEQVDNYFWLVVEKLPPYNATIYSFESSDIMTTTKELEYYLNKIADAKAKNFWPGYSDQAMNAHGILQATLPPYYLNP